MEVFLEKIRIPRGILEKKILVHYHDVVVDFFTITYYARKRALSRTTLSKIVPFQLDEVLRYPAAKPVPGYPTCMQQAGNVLWTALSVLIHGLHSKLFHKRKQKQDSPNRKQQGLQSLMGLCTVLIWYDVYWPCCVQTLCKSERERRIFVQWPIVFYLYGTWLLQALLFTSFLEEWKREKEFCAEPHCCFSCKNTPIIIVNISDWANIKNTFWQYSKDKMKLNII